MGVNEHDENQAEHGAPLFQGEAGTTALGQPAQQGGASTQEQGSKQAGSSAAREDAGGWGETLYTVVIAALIGATAGWFAGNQSAPEAGAAAVDQPVLVMSVSDWINAMPDATEEESFEMMQTARDVSRQLSEQGYLVLRQEAVLDTPAHMRIRPEDVQAGGSE